MPAHREPRSGAERSEARVPVEGRGPRDVPAARQLERIRTEVFDDHGALARDVAGRIARVIRDANAAGRRAVLGLATGSTPIGVYRELVRMHREEGLSFAEVETFNLDEYLPMQPESEHSYHRFMWMHLFSHVDIKRERVHILDGTLPSDAVAEHCAAFERAILEAGGIDFQLLGIGKTGHIGFNEPGSGIDSRTRRIHLDRVTRRDAAADFFSEKNVPLEALTMGVATILAAREVAILATGEHKAAVVQRSVEGEVDHNVPATFLQRHPRATFFLDAAASASLTRVATPWVVDEVQWTPELEVRAVLWLSEKTGRAILKLAENDYAEHHLGSLLARHGEAGTINGRVFWSLANRIRGRTRLPARARIVVFSPHPDDDVISMGGILRKLTQNENDIIVAYMTSGNIAVFDHDVRRHLDVVERVARERKFEQGSFAQYVSRVRAALEAKQAGEPDLAEVADLKRIIRESEAVSGIETLGLEARHARFLDLPFYQTGRIEKSPVGPADIKIVRDLLAEHRPHYIFVAGDLSDPHGTHRMCKDAIDAALAELHPRRTRGVQEPAPEEREHAGEKTFAPEVWLYRGAWQEWPVAEATWLVPLSREELRLKIQAIFKHQSQKDSAPFPGQDEREFWQRVEARNTGTADLLDRLGLAEYNAIEAYVVD